MRARTSLLTLAVLSALADRAAHGGRPNGGCAGFVRNVPHPIVTDQAKTTVSDRFAMPRNFVRITNAEDVFLEADGAAPAVRRGVQVPGDRQADQSDEFTTAVSFAREEGLWRLDGM